MKIFIIDNIFFNLENPQVMQKISPLMFFGPPYWKIGKLFKMKNKKLCLDRDLDQNFFIGNLIGGNLSQKN